MLLFRKKNMKKSYTNDPLRLLYLPMIFGLIFIGFGVWMLVTPGEFFITWSLSFAFAFVVTGLLEVIYAISSRHYMPNWAWLIGGILLLSRPQISMNILPFFVGFGILFRSIMSITWSIELQKLGDQNWRWMLSIGIVGLLFSFLLLWNLVFVRLTTALCAGIYLIIIGFTQPFLSLRLSRIDEFRMPRLLESTTNQKWE
jgi:uncharacterized membrane protein HdeD (DUF308 family)